MKVIKRDGSLEDFDINKIINAVTKAFKSQGCEINYLTLKEINYIFSNEKAFPINVEVIQDTVERILMDLAPYKVAKSYIIYREKHKNIRDFVNKKLQFIQNYSLSDNTANATIDDNANVSNHNIAVLNSEIHKEDNQLVNFKMLENQVRKLFPDFDYTNMMNDFNTIAYLHDSSSQIGMPYTYSSKEVIEVMYNGKYLLLPLDLLYSIVDEEEILVDSDNIVYQKTPWHLYVKDINNSWTAVTKLTKKKRHRPLVRVKTAFGEDLVVTDNHPMIVDIDNIEDTIQAKDCLNCRQFRADTKLKFREKTQLDLVSIFPTWVNASDCFIKYQQTVLSRIININRELGYIIGFFVGDGGYNNTSKHLEFTQKEKSVLDNINSMIFRVFGIAGNIKRGSGNCSDKYILTLANQYIYELFRGFFKIQDKAQNKTLPYNILEFNEEFAKGCLEGLIDSDGTIKTEDCNINIRLASRACILQCTYLFRHFGYSVGNSIQSLPFSNNSSYNTNYTIWGINATKRETSVDLNGSFKVRERLVNTKCKSLKYKSYGYCNVTSVEEIEKESAFYGLNEYIYDITTDTHTFVSNNILVHNCVAISLYPFLLNGLKTLGGLSAKPKNIDSFCGMFVNLVFAIASQYKGAVAVPGLLLCMDWYLRKEWGDDYYKNTNTIINSPICKKQKTIQNQIHQYFQQICYTLMQPSGSRGNQACFWNVSIFDKPFFDTMYGEFYFPDNTKPIWESVNWLQKDFMHWLNQERLKCILTFPVVSLCLIYQNGEFIDKELYDFACKEYSEGNSFFTYISDSADSLSSCCRLSSKLSKPQFNFTNGQLSEMTGSKNVITLDMNRIIQDWYNSYCKEDIDSNLYVWAEENYDSLVEYLNTILERIYKYQVAYNKCLIELKNYGLLSVYNAGFIDMKKQYLTTGINGLNQAWEFLNGKCNYNKHYMQFCNIIFTTIKAFNTAHKTKELMFNTEFTPCESASIKLYNRDKKDGYWTPNDTNLYASYIYKPNDTEISVLDKIRLHGREFCGDNLDGGSSAHINLDAHLSDEQYHKLLKFAAEVGCKYFTFNIPNCECEDCGYIAKQPFNKCPNCGSTNVSLWDRIIGYLTKIKNWSKGRQIEQKTRVYSKI